jgi:conjugative relaxase-like TrwC/TraI family protein
MMSIGAGSEKYFEKEFEAAQERYLSDGDRVAKGTLAEAFGLEGEVTREQYGRLCRGEHPITGKKLIRDIRGETYLKDGETKRRVGHRPGWDVTFSAPKSVSEAALVGGDRRLIEAHRKAVSAALGELEKFAQARTGARSLPKTTGNLCMIQFEHDAARPVDGFAAPQLHTHNFVMNMTKDGPGKYRSLNTRVMYEAQHYLTTVYRAALAKEVRDLGYEIVPTKNGAFELKGYDEAYLTAISPRSVQRDEALLARGLEYSPAAAQAAVLDTRQPKLEVGESAIRGMWAERAELFGVTREETKTGEAMVASYRFRSRLVDEAVTYGLERALDRTGEAEETRVLAEALKYRIGEVGLEEAKRNLAARIGTGEVIEVSPARPVGVVTTPEFARLRREMETMATREVPAVKGSLSGKGLGREEISLALGAAKCRRQVIEIDGAKNAALPVARVVAEGLEGSGYQVKVVAGASREKFGDWNALELGETEKSGPTVYVVADEAVTSLRAFHGFLSRLEPQDRVVIVGDARRRLAIGENALMGTLRESGMPVFSVSGEVRERNARVMEATWRLTEGKTAEAVKTLQETGRVVAAPEPERRAELAASFYAPDAVVVSGDDRIRERVTETIRENLRVTGKLDQAEETFRVLVPRQDMRGEARAVAKSYRVGDVVEYRETSARFEKGERLRVAEVAGRMVTVEREEERVTYDPRFLRGVTVYEEQEKRFAVGDRVRFTSDAPQYGLTASTTGEIRKMTPERVTVAVTEKNVRREVEVARADFRAVDHGYAVGRTEDLGGRYARVIVETATGRHDKATVQTLREATADIRIVTDDLAAFPAATAKLFPASRRRTVEPSDRTLVVAENPDIGMAAAELRASRVTVAYEKLHRWVTGEDYAGESFDEERLAALANKPANPKYVEETTRMAKAAGIETRPPEDALAAAAERVRVAARASVRERVEFVRGVMTSDGVQAETTERIILGKMLERLTELPAKRQTELATVVMEKLLPASGHPPLTAREREHFTEMMDRNGTTGWFVGTPREPGVCEGFRNPPRTEREAVLAVGLATGILEGIARRPDADLGRRAAQTLDDYLKLTTRIDLLSTLNRIGESNALCASNGQVNADRRMVLMVDQNGLTQENWKALQNKFGDNQGLFVVFKDDLTTRDREALADLARRDPNIQLGTARSLGETVRLELNSASGQTRTIDLDHSPKPDRGFSFGR